MIMTKNGYAIEQYPSRNEIIITLPQTEETLTNTITPVRKRKKKLNGEELAVIVTMVERMMEVDDEAD